MSLQRWSRVYYWSRVVARLILSFVFLSYSVAKLVGTQFIDSGPTLDKPVGGATRRLLNFFSLASGAGKPGCGINSMATARS